MTDDPRQTISHVFAPRYSRSTHSVAPGMLLRAMLLQVFCSIRSERQLTERLEFDLMFRWFVGLDINQ